MESVNIILNDGKTKSVNGIFYIYNSKYYFMYTMGELDETDYVKLYLVEISREVVNTPNGPSQTGYLLGKEVLNSEEWKLVQQSITKIVDDKKNNTKNSEIQYLPISMLVNLKIKSQNKFKLLKNLMEEIFKINIKVIDDKTDDDFDNKDDQVENLELDESMIIDYRTKFFEEQDKNKELQEEIDLLKEKIDNIKKIIE